MNRTGTFVLAMTLLVAAGLTGLRSAAAPPDVDIWKAAATGNVEAIKLHLEAGTDVDAKEPPGGSSPLLVAAAFGQVEAAQLLIEKGANVNAKSNDGATALHGAAFFCHTETVQLLLGKDADVNAKNIRGETPIDAVAGKWSPELEGIYEALAGLWNMHLDLEKIEATCRAGTVGSFLPGRQSCATRAWRKRMNSRWASSR